MTKFYGEIGYVETVEETPGKWVEKPVKRYYCGDILRNSRRLESSGNVNDNINISNEISILADPYADGHINDMRYIEFKGTKWKISNVEDKYPRLILTLGGVYNG